MNFNINKKVNSFEINQTIDYVSECWHHVHQILISLPYLRMELCDKPKEFIDTLLLPKLAIVAGMLINSLEGASEYHRFDYVDTPEKIAQLYSEYSGSEDNYAIVEFIYNNQFWETRYLSTKVYICLFVDLLQSLGTVAIDDKDVALYLVDLLGHKYPYGQRWRMFTYYLFDMLVQNSNIFVTNEEINPKALATFVEVYSIGKCMNPFTIER